MNSNQLQLTVHQQSSTRDGDDAAFRIAIVGFGPKGLYAFERLLAELCNNGAPATPVEIHLFNRSPNPAAGDVYRPDQPHYLLMNFSNAHIDASPHSSPPSIAGQLPNLVQWLAENGFDADPHGYTPRAIVGRYLIDVWTRLRDACPSSVQVHLHHAEVFDLLPVADGGPRLNLRYRKPGRETHQRTFNRVMLTTGHQQPTRSDDAATIDFIYPVSQLDEQAVPSGSQVAIRGLGLTFIDAALMLTEGRGGNFHRAADGEFHYCPSGREPVRLLPFSRSGLPMVPRGRTHGIQRPAATFFTDQAVNKLRDARGTNGLDFEQDLLPLLFDEMTLAYYRAAVRTEKGHEHEAHPAPPATDHKALMRWIDAFHQRHPHHHRFHPRQLIDPFGNRPIVDDDPHQSLLDYWALLNRAADLGEINDPLAAAATTWRHLCARFAGCYRDGGLSAASHRVFLRQFAGHFNRLAFGPPLLNSRKIFALCRAGLIDFSLSRNPRVSSKPNGEFYLSSCPDHSPTRCDVLIDARIPRLCASSDPAPLFRRLIERGLARPYVNRNATDSVDREDFSPGCVEITADGQLVTREGQVEMRVTLYGTPTEGLTWDNDTLSRRHNDFASKWARATARSVTTLISTSS